MVSGKSGAFPRLYAIAPGDVPISAMERGRALGFSQALVRTELGLEGLQLPLVPAEIWLDLALHDFPLSHPLVDRRPVAFSIRLEGAKGPLDPRRPPAPAGRAAPRFDQSEADDVLDWWADQLVSLMRSGVSGFAFQRPDLIPPRGWARLITPLRREGGVALLARTSGVVRDVLPRLQDCGFDFCLSSQPWWDGRASWFVEEHAALSLIAPVIADLGSFGAPLPATSADRISRLWVACAVGDGLIVPAGYEQAGNEDQRTALRSAVRKAVSLFEREPVLARPGRLKALTGPTAPVTALLRQPAHGNTERSLLVVLDPGPTVQQIDPAVAARAGVDLAGGELLGGTDTGRPLEPGEARLLAVGPMALVVVPMPEGASGAKEAASGGRVIVDNLSPQVDGGQFPVKRAVGDRLVVEADIFADGHAQMGGEVLFKAEDKPSWSRLPMALTVNDRWRATILLRRVGRHELMVRGWIDDWGTFARDLIKKRDAGQKLDLDVREGIALLKSIRERAAGCTGTKLGAVLAEIEAAGPEDRVELLLREELRLAVAEADTRPFQAVTFVQTVEVERPAARFAAWYELFPRSQTDDPKRPGMLRDVIRRLPDIRRMGFDVLYFPPVHPIGLTNRKGRDNNTTAGPDDPGSPYAIGSPAGGHDAIDPGLGTFEDFQALLSAAREHGLELALDFAIQCSPDHPWLKRHPGWFAWRPDGSMKYAENPPKKYEDIVNVDFYKPTAIPDLWLALRDIVLFWIGQGVRIFRVDNPHTKPLSFWRWMIADIRGAHPEVIFLSEAFTRPKLMYHLAKVGFSQSYTYFTWRHSKREFTDYITELTTTEVREFFRPNFFVNTPDINPVFLQTSGRAGFLIRAALAATLSGLWGVYSGFELCEAEPLPGREEYKDSEKYEIKPRDWNRPGNIKAEIAALNRIRKSHPALQSHLGVAFYNAFNDQVLYFAKAAAGERDKVLVFISLDPHAPEDADFEVPLWEWGLPDNASVDVFDLLHGNRFVLTGKIQHISLTPGQPYAIWRVEPRRAA